MDLVAFISFIGAIVVLVLCWTRIWEFKGFTFGLIGVLVGTFIGGTIISYNSIEAENTWELTEMRDISEVGGYPINSETGKIAVEIYKVPYCFFGQVKYVALCNKEEKQWMH